MNEKIVKMNQHVSKVYGIVIDDQDEFESYINTIANNYCLSAQNSALIHFDDRNYTLVMSRQQWMIFGREVRKYSKIIYQYARSGRPYYVACYDISKTIPLDDGKSYRELKMFLYNSNDRRVAQTILNIYGVHGDFDKAIDDWFIKQYGDNLTAKMSSYIFRVKLSKKPIHNSELYGEMKKLNQVDFYRLIDNALVNVRQEIKHIYPVLQKKLPLVDFDTAVSTDTNSERPYKPPIERVKGKPDMNRSIPEPIELTQNDIDDILRRGSMYEYGKVRIYNIFKEVASHTDRVKFLIKEYGIGGFPFTTSSGKCFSCNYNGKGLSIDDKNNTLLSYRQIEKRIDYLIKHNEYMSRKNLFEFIVRYFEKQKSEAISSIEDFLFQYKIGNNVTLNGKDYTVTLISDNEVSVTQVEASLFSEKYDRTVFDDLLLENVYENRNLLMLSADLAAEQQNEEKQKAEELFASPQVIINFSEHPALSGSYIGNPLSFAYANTLLGNIDMLENSKRADPQAGHYYKTDFDIIYSVDGEHIQSYNGRYDLADGETDIINHISAYRQFFAGELSEEKKQLLDDLLNCLKQHTSLSDDELLEIYNIVNADYGLDVDEDTVIRTLSDEEKNAIIGRELEYEGTVFRVKSIGINNQVNLEDISSEKKGLLPIDTVLDYEVVISILNAQVIAPTDNYVINNDNLGAAKPSIRYLHNIQAIKLLNEIEQQKRFATKEEQSVLAEYVGWGGLSESFNREDRVKELQELLSPEDFKSAKASSLTAFYTPPYIIKGMYGVLEEMGFTKGNILDPALGVGHFFGSIPEALSESKLYGVEIDNISGRIAKQLYPNANIQISGFEEISGHDNYFDVAVGNVPFGSHKVFDKLYNKYHLLIHDYFFIKTLDKVRPGGIVAFITSTGTLDKKDNSVRKMLAERAELLGAIRLPNTVFKGAAGTDVSSDILFLQKRAEYLQPDKMPDWINTDYNEENILINSYFVSHTLQICGKMEMQTGPHGMMSVCVPDENRPFQAAFENALSNIKGEYKPYNVVFDEDEADEYIQADDRARNFSYYVNTSGELFYRENTVMKRVDAGYIKTQRIKGMVAVADVTRQLIEAETDNYSDELLQPIREKLNVVYDKFVNEFGCLNSYNNNVFKEDNSYCLLLSLENVKDSSNKRQPLVEKADIFFRRTISPFIEITSADSSDEALIISMQQRGRVDIEYMAELTKQSEDTIISELIGRKIFLKPYEGEYVIAEEYLSGNVKEKLKVAKMAAEADSSYQTNARALEKVIPKDIPASEIAVELGATWLPSEYLNEFMYELFKIPIHFQRDINIQYASSARSGTYFIKGKNYSLTFNATEKYGIKNIKTGYEILEDTLNLRKSQVKDLKTDPVTGKDHYVLNPERTVIAQQIQEQIRAEFKEWIIKTPERRREITRIYNDRFNCVVARKYDGSNLVFQGKNNSINFRQHQLNAIARQLYGGNALLAHSVGAGKTYEMIAGAMLLKQMGIVHKSIICVPKHLTGQTGAEFYKLYPTANILVADEKDFTPKNRKRFCTKIATGNYDAIIIGHTQLEKIPLKKETQMMMLEEQLEEIIEALEKAKRDGFEKATVKGLELTRKSLENRLKELQGINTKDDVICFEELGVDQLYVDEAHYFKNLYIYTKMRNVAGIGASESGRAFDMYQKVKYISKLHPGRGIVFATGTPISNSMSEMYTLQRYLQPEYLKDMGIFNFDDWASTFGETKTSMELAPEGNAYRAKTRFSKFNNVPELMTGFSQIADIQTADTLNLPVPKSERHNVQVLPTEEQEKIMSQMSKRADSCRSGSVDPKDDNMLKITNDGRCAALDPRVFDSSLSGGNKVPACARNIFEIWKQSNDKTQIVFCDLSTPKTDKQGHSSGYCVYDDLKQQLVEYGIPEKEIQFMQHFKTSTQKEKLFNDVRQSKVRVIIGSTSTMGTGTNIQDKLIALHHLDCPYRPSDLEQREGRIIRQGNQNELVHIFSYVTKNSFDAYLYQIVENKQGFIAQVMRNDISSRSIEDVDEVTLNYAEIKALASGNPLIAEKVKVDADLAKITLLRSKFYTNHQSIEDDVMLHLPQKIDQTEKSLEKCRADYEFVLSTPKPEEFSININGVDFKNKSKAIDAVFANREKLRTVDEVSIGEYRGFKLVLCEGWIGFNKEIFLSVKRELSYRIELDPATGIGNITRLNNLIDTGIETSLKRYQRDLDSLNQHLESAKEELKTEFAQENEYQQLIKKQAELNAKLTISGETKPTAKNAL